MVVAILSWGHATTGKLPRFSNDWLKTPIAKAQVPLGPMAIQGAMRDFSISLSEHSLRFSNHHFWLASTDESWHRPMQVYLRAMGAPKSKMTIEKARQAWEARNRTYAVPKPFESFRYNSPRDEEVGFRRRPINMTEIHYLDFESKGNPRVITSWIPTPKPEAKAYAKAPWHSEAPASSSQGRATSQSASSSSRSGIPYAWCHEMSPEEKADFNEFAEAHQDDPAFVGPDIDMHD